MSEGNIRNGVDAALEGVEDYVGRDWGDILAYARTLAVEVRRLRPAPETNVVRWRHRPEHGDMIRSAWGDFVRYDDVKHLLETPARPTCHYAGPCDYQSAQAAVDGPHCVTCSCEAPAEKANACQCDPNPSIGGSPPCPVHDVRSEG